MAISCPKCASLEARSLSRIYREGLPAAGPETRTPRASWRAAAPPRRQSVAGWLLFTVVAGSILVASLGMPGAPGVGTAVLGAAFVSGVLIAVKARRYNAAEFPARMSRWERSFMCGSCGAVYTMR